MGRGQNSSKEINAKPFVRASPIAAIVHLEKSVGTVEHHAHLTPKRRL
jgi:hypothetical protein